MSWVLIDRWSKWLIEKIDGAGSSGIADELHPHVAHEHLDAYVMRLELHEQLEHLLLACDDLDARGQHLLDVLAAGDPLLMVPLLQAHQNALRIQACDIIELQGQVRHLAMAVAGVK